MAASDLGKMAEAVIVVAAVMGHELPPRAAEAMARELVGYPPSVVANALKRCQRELRGRLALADILQRIDDGHPAPEAAWALCQDARDENKSVVWTDEIAGAFGVARPLLEQDDHVAARMAFLESYRERLRVSRAESRGAVWWPTLGHDRAGRSTAVLAAVERGHLTAAHARRLVGGDEQAERRLALIEGRRDPALPPVNEQALAALVQQASPRRLP